MDKKMIYRELNLITWKMVTFIMSIIVFSGCSSSLYQSTTYEGDDMYATHNREEIIKVQTEKAEAYKRAIDQRKAYWAEELGISDQVMYETQNSELYNTPYGEKLIALSALTAYQKPSSYYALQYDDTLNELAKYDPSEYDAYISESGEIVIESKYINSMYGIWGNSLYNNYGMRYGYGYGYGYPMWGGYYGLGYPSYMWWDYYGYNYGWGFGYSPYYYGSWWGGYPYYGYNWYRPSYNPRPPHNGGSGSNITRSIVRQPIITSAPSTYVGRRNVNGSTVGSSTGTTYNRGTTRSSSSSSYSTPTRVPTSTSTPSISTPTRSTNSIGR